MFKALDDPGCKCCGMFWGKSVPIVNRQVRLCNLLLNGPTNQFACDPFSMINRMHIAYSYSMNGVKHVGNHLHSNYLDWKVLCLVRQLLKGDKNNLSYWSSLQLDFTRLSILKMTAPTAHSNI